MLVEIKSSVFRRKDPVTFHSGLNVIMGDNAATNSIGKSSFLKIIDYVFGGETYVKHNTDAIDELGHHEIFFKFQFDGIVHNFSRSTDSSNVVFYYNSKGDSKEAWDIAAYCNFLRLNYALSFAKTSFRSIVGIYARVWGKENANNVTRPLNSHSREPSVAAIDVLLKLFNRYEEIRELEDRLESLNKQIDYLNKAYKGNVVRKLNARSFEENEEKIKAIQGEIGNIKNQLAKYAVNIKQIVNDEIIEVKEIKDRLLDERLGILSKLTTLNNNISNAKYIRARSFNKLKLFFPGVDLARIEEIELFHSKISSILKNEMRGSAEEFKEKLTSIDAQLAAVDFKISKILSSVENPSIIVDRTISLIEDYNERKRENQIFDNGVALTNNSSEVEKSLDKKRSDILHSVEDEINEELSALSGAVYGDVIHHPIISFRGNEYIFTTPEDTGTGRAFSSVILFDLAILKLTALPILIHDSYLFKNIQTNAIESIINVYDKFDKQIFIVLDEIEKYDSLTIKLLLERCVLFLSKDEILYTKTWK